MPEAGWFRREKRRDDDDQGDGLGGNDGTVYAGGVGKSRALPGGSPYGLGEPTPGGPSPLPPGSLVARRYAPTGPAPRVKQRLTVDGPLPGGDRLRVVADCYYACIGS